MSEREREKKKTEGEPSNDDDAGIENNPEDLSAELLCSKCKVNDIAAERERESNNVVCECVCVREPDSV